MLEKGETDFTIVWVALVNKKDCFGRGGLYYEQRCFCHEQKSVSWWDL